MTVVIAAVPLVDTTEAIMAPALLKACLSEHGIASTAIDLNIDIVNQLATHPRKQQLWDFFFTQKVDAEIIDDFADIVNYCAEEICKHQPTVIGLSLLTYSCQIFTRWLCAKLRVMAPNAKIVIGGTGIKNFIADYNNSFCQQCVDQGLIDDYITGDGDISFVEYIKGNLSYPGINSTTWQRVPDLNAVPIPDYDDYDFSKYQPGLIPLCDSRGCVKNCEFCDIIEYWSKYQWRTAESIFNEMLSQIERYNKYAFAFRNSLVNGNMKEFKLLLDLICDYNRGRPREQQISWEGYFIVRSKSQHPTALWEKMRDSNGTLFIGVESVVAGIRQGMGKTFTNADLDYHLEAGLQYNVPMILLLIVGYPTETLADYEYTKQWFRDHKQYATHPVIAINLSLAGILPGTQLARNAEKYSLKTHPKIPSVWVNQNLKITAKQRLAYLCELQQLCTEECGFHSLSNQQTMEHSVSYDDQY